MKQPRKAQLRRKIEQLTRRLDAERERASHAETLRTFDHQLVDDAQRELNRVSAWVTDIVRTLNYHQPASALLPQELRLRSVPAGTDRMVPPTELPNYFRPEKTFDDYRATEPIVLTHLRMFLEEHPDVWARLVDVTVQDRTSEDPTFRHSVVRYAVSREMMLSLLRDKNYFVEHILRHMGTQLFHHLNKSK